MLSYEGLPDKYWELFKTAWPCHLGNYEFFLHRVNSGDFKPEVYLREKGDFSIDSVLEYFLGPHNHEAFSCGNYEHMFLAYEVDTFKSPYSSILDISVHKEHLSYLPIKLRSFVFDNCDLKDLQNRGIVESKISPVVGDRVFIHGDYIVNYERGKK